MEREKRKDIYLYFNERKGRDIFEKIENKKYNLLKVLKDDQRSYVALIEIDNEQYVYKQPLEKNRRKWQIFLSIFRVCTAFSLEYASSVGPFK